jgi:hypothetical protein
MKLARLLPLSLLLLVAAGEPALVPDPSLDDLWFKVGVKAKGRGIPADGSQISKVSGGIPAWYLHLDYADDPPDGMASTTLYGVQLWYEYPEDDFHMVDAGTIPVVVTSLDQYVLPDVELHGNGPDGTQLDMRATLLVRLERNKADEIVGAKLTTLGAEVFFGGLASGGGFFYGSAKLKGKLIAAEELPFTP